MNIDELDEKINFCKERIETLSVRQQFTDVPTFEAELLEFEKEKDNLLNPKKEAEKKEVKEELKEEKEEPKKKVKKKNKKGKKEPVNIKISGGKIGKKAIKQMKKVIKNGKA